jgi:catechol 2,3-dioxygenase-like lactoylglutathione lyase family enzyme
VTARHETERRFGMPVDLDHIIVHATDPRRSATALAELLGVPVLPDWGPFVRVQTSNRVTLDYMRDDPPFTAQHCALLVDDETFDAAHRRLLDAEIPIYADPWRRQPGEINHLYGGRGVYFDDPDGHLMELITTPYGPTPEGSPSPDRSTR